MLYVVLLNLNLLWSIFFWNREIVANRRNTNHTKGITTSPTERKNKENGESYS